MRFDSIRANWLHPKSGKELSPAKCGNDRSPVKQIYHRKENEKSENRSEFSQYEGVVYKRDIPGTPLKKGMTGCIIEPPDEHPPQEYIVETHAKGVAWWGYVPAKDLLPAKAGKFNHIHCRDEES